MSSGRWERVRDAFSQALDLVPAEREAFVALACGGEPDLAEQVVGLLRAHAAADGFLDAPPDDGTPDPIGRRVGAYRILAEIGSGGMGTVYRARRDDESYLKDVALKLLPGPFAPRALASSFRRERVILGRLEHPNIARLLDGGTTDDGEPWFAMEFVDGRPLDEHCARERLDLRRRIEIFRVVCGAVAHAHRSLVVHRDLKAGNVLVTADGTPKLLDFGIAKLLEDEPAEGGLTMMGLRPMTPECASPEQVTGGPVTTATDVYALGVMLYELLSGRRPYTFATRTPEEIARVVCHQEPAPPSRAVAAAAATWQRLLPGDLDTIVLKALRKEPERRYASADDLSEDLRRYLHGEPVRACKDSLGYRARKFVRRHRGAVSAAALVAASLVGGLGVALQQAHLARLSRERALERSRDAQRLANSLVFELHDAIQDVPGTTRARGLVLQRASAMLDRLAADAPDDPVLGEDLAAAYHRLGDVLGTGTGSAELGDHDAALAAHRKGLDLRERLAAAAPLESTRQYGLAESEVEISYALVGPEATRYARQAAERAERLHSASPGDLQYAKQVARAVYALGASQVGAGDLAAATASFERYAAMVDAVVAARPEDEEAGRNATLGHRRLGAILAREGRLPEALAHYRQAVPWDERQVARHPDSVQARLELSVSLVDFGWALQANGDHRAARAQYERALAIREALLAADPANAQARRVVGSVLDRLAGLLSIDGDPRRGLECVERARRVLGSEASDAELWAGIHRTESHSLSSLRRFGEARQSARVAQDAFGRLLAREPANARLKLGLAWASVRTGDALVGLAQGARAQPTIRAQELREAASAYGEALRLGTEVKAAGQLAAASEPLLDEALAGLRRARSGR